MEPEFFNKLITLENDLWWYIVRRQIIEKALDFIKIHPKSDIFEVGCGNGGNLELLSRYGSLYAIEKDDKARKISNDRQIIDVQKGSLPDSIPFGDKQFDLITLFDVLEHIDDDLGALKIIRNRIKDDGKLLITVPAYNFLWSELDVMNQHKRRYRMGGLKSVIRKAGFMPVYATYFNTILFPAISAVRLVCKMSGKEFKGDREMPSQLVNDLLARVFSVEKNFIPKVSLPFGVSILVIAQVVLK
jgi:SAM-dependent methyltransferase